MFIDSFAETWREELSIRANRIGLPNHLYLLLDGAFVPGLHSRLADGCKEFLFSTLPGCTQEVLDASPFVTLYRHDDWILRSILRRCDRWPMVSVIETPESLENLCARLSAWCIVEADGQRFNFRFPDTRRLPAIFRTLTLTQREQLVGPAIHWSYISRDGRWLDLEIQSSDTEIATEPKLDAKQFATLVLDSQADEIMVLLGDRGHEVFRHPSRSHELASMALSAVLKEELEDNHVLDWCEYCWLKGDLLDPLDAPKILGTWKNVNL